MRNNMSSIKVLIHLLTTNAWHYIWYNSKKMVIPIKKLLCDVILDKSIKHRGLLYGNSFILQASILGLISVVSCCVIMWQFNSIVKKWSKEYRFTYRVTESQWLYYCCVLLKFLNAFINTLGTTVVATKHVPVFQKHAGIIF